MLWEGSQDHVPQLHGIVWQRIDKVEVEVAQELGVVFEDDKHDVHCGGVETAHGGRTLRPRNQILLHETETAHYQVLHLVQLGQVEFRLVTANNEKLGSSRVNIWVRSLSECLFACMFVDKLRHCSNCYLLRVQSLNFQEIRHEQFVGDEFEPRKSKSGVIFGAQIVEQSCQIKQNLSSIFVGEVFAHRGTHNVHKHAVVGFLVEVCVLSVMILVQLASDELENFLHEL